MLFIPRLVTGPSFFSLVSYVLQQCTNVPYSSVLRLNSRSKNPVATRAEKSWTYSSGESAEMLSSPVLLFLVGIRRASDLNKCLNLAQSRVTPGSPEITSYNAAMMASADFTSASYEAPCDRPSSEKAMSKAMRIFFMLIGLSNAKVDQLLESSKLKTKKDRLFFLVVDFEQFVLFRVLLSR